MSASNPLRVGLIGVGRHGLRYAQHLGRELPEARLVAVARRDLALGVPDSMPPEAARYAEYTRLIADPSVEVVIAVVPPALHPSLAQLALQAGKPLLLEKPLAVDAAAVRAIVATASAAPVPLMVAQTLRYNRATQVFSDLLPGLGPCRRLVMQLTVPPRPRPAGNPGFGGRGALLDLGVHLADLLHWWIGSRGLTVGCTIDARTPDGVDAAATVTAVSADGLQAELHVGWEGKDRAGEARAEGPRGWATVNWRRHCVQSGGGAVPSVTESVPEGPTIRMLLTAFLDAVGHRTPPPLRLADAAAGVQFVDACYEAARTGTTVPVACDPAG